MNDEKFLVPVKSENKFVKYMKNLWKNIFKSKKVEKINETEFEQELKTLEELIHIDATAKDLNNIIDNKFILLDDGKKVYYNKYITESDNILESYKINGQEIASTKEEKGYIVKRVADFGFDLVSDYEMKNIEKVRNKKKDFLKEEKIDKKTNKTISMKLKGPILDEYDKVLGRFTKEIQYEKNGLKHTLITEEVYNSENSKTIVVEEFYDSKASSSRTKIVDGKLVFQILKSKEMSLIKDYDEYGNVKNVYEYNELGKPMNPNNVFKNLQCVPREKSYYKDYMEYEKLIDSIGVSRTVRDILNMPYQINPSNEVILSKANSKLIPGKGKNEKIK